VQDVPRNCHSSFARNPELQAVRCKPVYLVVDNRAALAHIGAAQAALLTLEWGVATCIHIDQSPGEVKMNCRFIIRSIVAALIITSSAVHAGTLDAPGTCPNDSKLLNGGPTKILGEGPGTWWGLVMNGLVAAGFVEENDQIDYLNDIFGTGFDTLEQLETYNLQLVEDTWDANHNGYICAFQLRGRRAYLDNPYVDLTFFGINDDKVAKK